MYHKSFTKSDQPEPKQFLTTKDYLPTDIKCIQYISIQSNSVSGKVLVTNWQKAVGWGKRDGWCTCTCLNYTREA